MAYNITNPKKKKTLKNPAPREAKPWGNFAYMIQYKANGAIIQEITPPNL